MHIHITSGIIKHMPRKKKIEYGFSSIPAPALLLLVLVILWVYWWRAAGPKNEMASPIPLAVTSYQCNENKTIEASFYAWEPTDDDRGISPAPKGSAILLLSDGRKLLLDARPSAHGVRYVDASGTVSFTTKGRMSSIEENRIESYTNCIALAPDPGGLERIYIDTVNGFTFRYPNDYPLNSNYRYYALKNNSNARGVKVFVSDAITTSTNLAADSGVSIESVTIDPASSTPCAVNMFLDAPATSTRMIENGVRYSVATTTDAAAGNRYEETVWLISGTNPCIAIRYFIHYTNRSNFGSESIAEFDRQTLLNVFNKIRWSLILASQ